MNKITAFLARHKTLLAYLILSLHTLASRGQNEVIHDQDWNNLLNQHRSGTLHDTIYLIKAQALTEKSFKDPSLKEKLTRYREIAWSNEDYRPFRVKYYAFLANHATAVHKEGFTIYYLEKMEKELQEIKPYTNSLNQPRLLLYIYGRNNHINQDKRIAIIDSVMPFLKSLPSILSKSPTPVNTCVNAFTILKHASNLYLERKDTLRVLESVNLAKQIWTQLEKIKGLDKGKMEQCQMSLFLTQCAGARILSDNKKEEEILKNAYKIITSKNQVTPLFKAPFERTILSNLIDFYIYQNDLDSTNHYFSKFKDKVKSYKTNESGDGTKFLLYSGRVHAMNKDYMAAYDDVLKAYEINDSIISVKMTDTHNNLFAHLIAEQSKEDLIKSEQQKRDQNVLIFTISIILLTTIFIFTWRLSVNRKKSDKQIEDLNKMTQIQIAELVASAHQVQKKMGMELHDDIAGRLVGICNSIETEALEEKDLEKRSRLETIARMARDTYKSTRLKSHDWYFTGTKEESAAFIEGVNKIVTQALPDGKYENQIEIDVHALDNIPPEMRIHLLRIIQEAVSNILKHAKADKVKLFMYEEDNLLHLQIIDNGKGFNKTHHPKKESVGLISLKNRVKEMNGTIDIITNSNGTEILCAIPVAINPFTATMA